MSHERLGGKVAIVTGAGAGIGRAEAILLAQQGVDVVANSIGTDDHGVPTADRVVEEIAYRGGRAIGTREDLNDGAAARRLVDAAVDTFGRLDIIVNNAGTCSVNRIEDISEDEWDEVMRVNLRAPFLLCKFAAPVLKQRGSGIIINTGSESGLGHAFVAGYAASKEGLIGLSRSLARELGPYGVRCNAVRPRALGTPMGDRYLEAIGPYMDEWAALGRYRVGERAGVGGVGGPDTVAPLVVWLCTDAARDLNGLTFAIEGHAIGVWSEPQLMRSIERAEGWDLDALDLHVPESLTFDMAGRFLLPATEMIRS